MPIILSTQVVNMGGFWFKASPGKNVKKAVSKTKRGAGDTAQVVKYRPSKSENLSSKP
jgi:hypothetical protein